MVDPARRPIVDALRVALRERFGADVDVRRRIDGEPIRSGWTRVDRALRGGLRPGRSALIIGSPGAGSLALASSWACETCRHGEPVVVLDATKSSMPHAWLEPEDARAPIWVLRVLGAQVWAALDISLRSGAFGMAVLLDPPRAPSGVGLRVARIARDRGTRVVLTQSPNTWNAPWTPDHRLRLHGGLVRWVDGPLGAVPRARQVEVRVGDGGGSREQNETHAHELDTGAITDRLRPAPRTPDRRASSKRGGRTRRTRGPSRPRDGGKDPVDE